MVNMPEESLIVVRDLCKSFDDEDIGVLNNISINIKRAELTALAAKQVAHIKDNCMALGLELWQNNAERLLASL